jgi:hypothetical protein
MEKRARRALLCLAIGVLPLLAFAPRARGLTASEPRTRQAGIACVFDQVMLHTAPGTCRPRARHYPIYVVGRVRRSIYDSALVFGIPYTVLLTIARCESSLNPRAQYRGHFGLYQFLPETFYRAARDLRAHTGVVARTFWSPLDSSYAAGFLFATGRSRKWACEKLATAKPFG